MARLHEMGKLSQNRLGRLAAMDPATIQGVIRRLHERGFIERLADPTDRRRMVLSLSPRGQETVVRLLESANRIGDQILAPLSRDETAVFLGPLKRHVCGHARPGSGERPFPKNVQGWPLCKHWG